MAGLLIPAFTVRADVPQADIPQVVVSIAPLHSLVHRLMKGVGEPVLLLSGVGSPHDYALKPSQARSIRTADVIFWMGPNLEGFLAKPIKNRGSEAITAPLLARLAENNAENDAPPLLLAYGDEMQDEHGHDHDSADMESGEGGQTVYNPHVWLDPTITGELVNIMAATLAEADPDHRQIYEANASDLLARLGALDDVLGALTAPLIHTPYVVMHDAYPYFIRRYGLMTPMIVTATPQMRPGGRHLRQIRKAILETAPACLFTEPASSKPLSKILVEETNVKTAQLDPLGTNIEPGENQYFQMMEKMGRSFRDCLTPDDSP